METIPGYLINAKFCDLVTHDGEWDISLVDSWMSVHLVDIIKACVSSSLHHTIDVFCFVGTGDHEFSIKEMFKTIAGHKC